MKRKKIIALVAAVVGFMPMAFSASPLHAAQPPQEGCIAVPKIQYDSAKRQHLLQNRFSTYVRTGRPFRRHYWFCH